MDIRSYVATNKTSGESYRYLLKISWQTRYYSCELQNIDREWFKSLGMARQFAAEKGLLVKVVMSKPELFDGVDLLTHAAAYIQTQVKTINKLPGDLTDMEVITRDDLNEAIDFLQMFRSQLNNDIHNAYVAA